jgi:toxin YoeB
MNLEFTETAWKDFMYWVDNDNDIVLRISELIKSIKRTPASGIGKPELLRFDFKGCWSRRINREHRIVYRIEGKKGVNQKCVILQCRYHYEK